MTSAASRWLACACLAVLVVLVFDTANRATLIGAVPLAAMALAALARWRHWTTAAALLMLPYFSYGMMNTITASGNRVRALGFTVLTVIVVLAAFDASRRRS